MPTHSRGSGQALKVGATPAWPGLKQDNPNSHAARRQTRAAVEKPPTIKIGGLESGPCATL
ncbi:MAG: hypothetical protein WCD04_05530 [Terriglobia bacterium]